LPGGSGTIEELLEAITLKRLGLHDLPIIILNTNGYFDPLIEMLNRAVEQQFLRPEDGKLWEVIEEPEEIEFYL